MIELLNKKTLTPDEVRVYPIFHPFVLRKICSEYLQAGLLAFGSSYLTR
jgi:hypothetical protein